MVPHFNDSATNAKSKISTRTMVMDDGSATMGWRWAWERDDRAWMEAAINTAIDL